jgi:hypothetical protein
MDNPGVAIAPAIVSFDISEEDSTWRLETPEIRSALDTKLNDLKMLSANQSNIETVAGTIFPESIWKRCGNSSEKLFQAYDEIWPLIAKCRPANSHGTYFRRLTSFKGTNQLLCIINAWKNNIHRRSALQAGIFDPTEDHRCVPYLGFPCLQQVIFHPVGPNGSEGMHIVALYANQYVIDKAYGNYLGLYRLGKFMAGEMGLILKKVICIASNLSLNRTKGECSALLKNLQAYL